MQLLPLGDELTLQAFEQCLLSRGLLAHGNTYEETAASGVSCQLSLGPLLQALAGLASMRREAYSAGAGPLLRGIKREPRPDPEGRFLFDAFELYPHIPALRCLGAHCRVHPLVEPLHGSLQRCLISPAAVVLQVGCDVVAHKGSRVPGVHGIAATDVGPPRIAMAQ